MILLARLIVLVVLAYSGLAKLGSARVRVAASDENSYTLALGTWRAFGGAKAAVAQVNAHAYECGGPRAA